MRREEREGNGGEELKKCQRTQLDQPSGPVQTGHSYAVGRPGVLATKYACTG